LTKICQNIYFWPRIYPKNGALLHFDGNRRDLCNPHDKIWKLLFAAALQNYTAFKNYLKRRVSPEIMFLLA